MADKPVTRTRKITRDKLAQFLPNQELIKAFENMSQDISETLPAAIAGTTDDAGSVMSNDAFRRREPAAPPLLQTPENSARVLAQAMFQPHPQPANQLPRDDEAGRILATQIFGG